MVTRKTKKLVYNTIVIALLVIGIGYVCTRFLHLGSVEYTDNAQVKQHITPINTRVQGFIKKIYFEEYKPIHKGDTLLVIEDAEFRLRLAQAEADLANALAGQQVTHAGIATTQNNLTVNDAGIEEVCVQRANAERELQRYKKLLEEDAVTRQQYDNVKTAYDAINARYEQALRMKHTTSLIKEEQTHQLGQNEAAVRLAQAAVDLARHNAELAGVEDCIRFEVADAGKFHRDSEYGQLVTNPPYGERLLEKKEAEDLYRMFGAALRDLPPKWRVLVLSSHTEFERCFGRPADKKRKLYNGMIKCDAFMYGR